MNLTYFWLIAFVILLIIELLTMGLTTIWFAIGAILAAFAAVIGLPLFVQILVFVLISLILLAFTRPIAMRYFNRNRARTNVDSLVGKQAIVLEEIDNLKATGQVVVDGQEWTARAMNNLQIVEPGAVVLICGVQGVKLIVNRLPEYQYVPGADYTQNHN